MKSNFLVVKTWKRVQDYLGTMIGALEGESLGIKWDSKSKNKRNGKLYYIPYTVLINRMIMNQRKIIKLQISVNLIREEYKSNLILQKIMEEKQIKNSNK